MIKPLKDIEKDIKKHAVSLFKFLDEYIEEVGQLKILKEYPYKGRLFDITTEKGVKKLLKHMYEAEVVSREYKNRLPKELFNTFNIHHEYDYVQTVYFFHKTENIMEVIEDYIPLEGTSINSPYDCTGQWFEREADVIELEDRIIVYQTSLMDV